MLPRLSTSFQQGGSPGIALVGPGGSKPDLPVEGLQLSVGFQVRLVEEDEDAAGIKGLLQVDGVVAGWNERCGCWFATYDWNALAWVPQPKIAPKPIEFDEWIRKAFDHAVTDHSWWWNEETGWNELPPVTSLEYLTRLFEGSGHLLRPYSDAQIDQGLWLLVGCSSDHARAFMDVDVPWPIRLRCVRSIMRLFDLFAARCSPYLSHLDEPGAYPLNSICYMFWDILPMHGRPGEAGFTELDRSLLDVMKEILRLPSDACRESALHGLGHWAVNYPNEVREAVRRFIASHPSIRPELRKYAERAGSGCVL